MNARWSTVLSGPSWPGALCCPDGGARCSALVRRGAAAVGAAREQGQVGSTITTQFSRLQLSNCTRLGRPQRQGRTVWPCRGACTRDCAATIELTCRVLCLSATTARMVHGPPLGTQSHVSFAARCSLRTEATGARLPTCLSIPTATHRHLTTTRGTLSSFGASLLAHCHQGAAPVGLRSTASASQAAAQLPVYLHPKQIVLCCYFAQP